MGCVAGFNIVHDIASDEVTLKKHDMRHNHVTDPKYENQYHANRDIGEDGVQDILHIAKFDPKFHKLKNFVKGGLDNRLFTTPF